MTIFSGVSSSDIPICIGGTREDDYDKEMFWIRREIEKYTAVSSCDDVGISSLDDESKEMESEK